MNADNKITMMDEHGNDVEFVILEETKLNGNQYILVEEVKDENQSNADTIECMILKDISDADDPMANYVFVEDVLEEQAVFEIFEHLMEDEKG